MAFTGEPEIELQSLPGVAMPFSPEAEQSVLGAVLLEPSCLAEVMEILPRAEYFYGSSNRLIYETMQELFTVGRPVDFITVLEKLKENGDFDESTGKMYLAQLAQIVPSITNVSVYANIVRDKYDVRTLMVTARSILDDASEGAQESSLMLDAAEQRIFDIRRGKSMKGLQSVKEILIDTFDRLDKLNSADKEKYRGIPTGINHLDKVITGLNRSDLLILAARPGVGKTSFALNISRNVAMDSKRRVAFFSLEMSKEQLVSRLLSSEASVEGSRLRSGDLAESDWAKLVEAGDILSKCELYFDDTPGITVPEIKAKVRRLKDVDLIVIDYLQLMSSAKRIDNRVQEISEITRSMKIMAKELNVPILLLSQLARSGEKRPNHKPMLSDLRDSGSIEQDADIVMFLYREGYYKDSETAPQADVDQNSCICMVAKNRHGETRDIDLHWQGEFMRFTSVEVIHRE